MNSAAKKVVSFILFVVILASVCAPLLVVNAASGHESHLDPEKEIPTMRENSINYTCQYDAENKKVLISGTVNHDTMIEHRDYFLDVYTIEPGQKVEDAALSAQAESKASMEIAIKFDFSISASTMTDRFSRYAVVLRSADGKKILGAEPQYVYVASTYEYNASDAQPYKGISSELTSFSASVNAGTAILPIYLNRLLSNKAGGIDYPLEDGSCYFDRLYVEELDAKIRTYSASGTRVYFQILLEANESEFALSNGHAVNALYDFPNLAKKENLQKISAAAEFLAERYEDKQSGLLSGLIVGSAIDQKARNYTGGLKLEEYAEQYAFYLLTVASAARTKNASLDVLIPFSEVDSYSASIVPDAGNYSPSLLLEEILSVLNDRLDGIFSCGTMIESEVLPLTWSNQNNAFVASPLYDVLSLESLSEYEAYLKGLQKSIKNAPSHFIYRWNVSASLDGNSLACNYAYTYYYLLRYENLSSFVISFDEKMQREALLELSPILRYIDTEKGSDVTQPLLSSFVGKNWEDVLKVDSLSAPEHRTVYRLPANANGLDSYTGSFEYFDVSTKAADEWFAGVGCQKIRSDFLNNDVRGIHSVMTDLNGQGPSELLCLYEYSENFIYTPYLKLTVELPSETDALYEITVSLGDNQTMILAEQLIPSGERCEIWLDLREVAAEDLMAEYIKIGAELIEGEAEEFSLWVLGLTGYSQEYTSEELAELINAERLRIRNENADEDNGDGKASALWIVFVVLLLISSLVLGVVLFFRRTEDDFLEEDEEQDDNTRAKK